MLLSVAKCVGKGLSSSETDQLAVAGNLYNNASDIFIIKNVVHPYTWSVTRFYWVNKQNADKEQVVSSAWFRWYIDRIE